MTKNGSPDWPLPSRRWRSFEAEAFHVTAYRYDKRVPSVIGREGFKGYSSGIEQGMPEHALFGANTIFSAGSRAGADNYLMKDRNVFRFQKIAIHTELDKLYGELASRGVSPDKVVLPHLYKISTDTHNTISFRDSYEQFGQAFNKYSIAEGRHSIPELAAKDEYISGISENDYWMQRNNKLLKGIYSQNDEIHINGPIAATEIKKPIVYAGLEHLNLEVPLAEPV